MCACRQECGGQVTTYKGQFSFSWHRFQAWHQVSLPTVPPQQVAPDPANCLSIPLTVPHNVQLTVMLIYKDGKCIPELPNICVFYNFLHIFPPSMNLIFTTVMFVFSVTFIQLSFYAFCTLCRNNILIIVLIQIHLKFYSVFSTLYWRKHT